MLDLEFWVKIYAASCGGRGRENPYEIWISLIIHSTFRSRQTDLERQGAVPYGVLQRLTFCRAGHGQFVMGMASGP